MAPNSVDNGLAELESLYIPPVPLNRPGAGGSESLAYTAYRAQIYRRRGYWIQSFGQIDLESNDRPIYFHHSGHIPYFEQRGYGIALIQGRTIDAFLAGIPAGALVLVAVKDDGSQRLSGEASSRLADMGIAQLDRSKLRQSYLWAARKLEGAGYEVLHEACSAEELRWRIDDGARQIELVSGGALSSNRSKIEIDGVEFSRNRRGWNVVVCPPDGACISTSFDVFATLAEEGSLYRAAPQRLATSAFRAIYHAGGQLNGIKNSNALEVFEQSYSIGGFRTFTADIELTADEEVVLRHDWQPGFALFGFLARYPDAYVIANINSADRRRLKMMFDKLISAAAPFGFSLLLRVIPQLQSIEMHRIVESIFPFPRYVYILDATPNTIEAETAFVRENKIAFVAVRSDQYTEETGARIREAGARVLVHGVNDMKLLRDLAGSVHGISTDSLAAGDIHAEIAGREAAQQARRAALSRFVQIRFGVDTAGCRWLESPNQEDWAELEERIYRAESADEIRSLLKSLK
ncbi:interleukin-like EMT inducer domain-containing protein [Paenibacillus sp. GCM10023250]|uniref:interleukin-like EMT inducer domain-containing protein n=1 Tax=Paenibacillus sp. GCM10023250 TaxID=3252648 RepID=UPI003617500E